MLMRCGYLILCAVFLSGCVVTGGHSFKLDYDTGDAEIVWHDIRSVKGSEDSDYSIEKDWASVRDPFEAEAENAFDPDVTKLINRELFEEDGVLSAKYEVQVQGPKCFPSKEALLKYLHKDTFYFNKFVEIKCETVNGEIFLFIPQGAEVVSTNGMVLNTNANSMIVWPEDAGLFEYHLKSKDAPRGESLLPFYLNDKEE